jgi:hypothetical protein
MAPANFKKMMTLPLKLRPPHCLIVKHFWLPVRQLEVQYLTPQAGFYLASEMLNM